MKKPGSTLWVILSGGVISAALSIVASFPSTALAEFYVGAMGGYAVPNDFSNVSGPAAPLPDLSLDNSAVVGGKIGYYFSSWKWLGVETEGFYLNSDVPAFGPSAELGVGTWAVNAIVRYPGERLQPYAGLGLGIFFAEAEIANIPLSNQVETGLNALAGVRAFLTDSIAVFGEYKYNRASFDFETTSNGVTSGLKGDYSVNMAVGGLAFHF